MTLAVEASHHQRFPINLDNMNEGSYHHSGVPQFTNPWASSAQQSGVGHSGYMQQQQQQSLDLDLRRPSQQHQPQQHHQQHHQQIYLPQPNPQHQQHQHQQHHGHQQQQQHQQQHSPGAQHQQSPSGPQHHHHNHNNNSSHRFSHAALSPVGQQKLPLGQQPLPPPTGIPASSMAYNTSPLTVTAPSTSQRSSSFVDQRSNLLSMPHDVLNSISRMSHSHPQQQQQQQQQQHQQQHQQHSASQVPLSAASTSSAAYADATTSYSSPSPIHPASTAYVTSGSGGAGAGGGSGGVGGTPYDQMGYAPATSMRGGPAVAAAAVASYGMDTTSAAAAAAADVARRYSQQAEGSQMDNRRNFQDAIEASHGIMSLSQDTPRPLNNYRSSTDGTRPRGSGDSYGFPTPHSATSSISGSMYNGGSVDSNITDYSNSTPGSDMDCQPRSLQRQSMMASRASYMGGPIPTGIHQPPAPQSMMGQFSSKQQSTAQKKHKCRVCDKRFTRPSSLQTHMYSHTGEKPFVCDFPGCSRPFSVVSNLRRHSKVHQRDGTQGSSPGQLDDMGHSD